MKIRTLSAALLLILPFLLVQCASTSNAPSETSDKAKTFNPVSDKGVVYLYRRGRAIGGAVATQIQVNGNDAGGTGPGTFFRWELDPGKYVFSAKSDESSAAVEVNVEAGKLYFVEQIQRIGLQSGRITIQQQDLETGKSKVKGLKLLISTYIP